MGYAIDLQKSLRATLVGNSAVTALVSERVYDEPPEKPTYPFIRFGEFRVEPYDTDDTLAAEVDGVLEVHDRPDKSGRERCTEVVEAVHDALHRQESSISLSDHDLTIFQVEDSTVRRMTDGRSYIGIISTYALLDGGN